MRVLARTSLPPGAPRLARMGIGLAGAAILALLLLGWSQLAAFRDPFAPWQEDAALLLGSTWGSRWTAALALASATLAALLAAPLRPLGFALPVVLAAYPAVSGHAAAVEGWTAAALAADWLHVLAAGTWMGALAVLLAGGAPGAPAAESLLVRHLAPFSVLARGSVATLVLTGGFASWLHLASVADLWGHPYGRVLALKVALVAAAMALGAWNWRVLSRRAEAGAGPRRLLRAARLEVALGGLVLVVTGWLTGMAPPP